jgi:hypothetical protein
MGEQRPNAVEILRRDLDPDNLLDARRRACSIARHTIEHRRRELAALNRIDRTQPRPVA